MSNHLDESCVNQYILTPAAGKRIIGMAMAHHPAVQKTLLKGTLVIIAGTTNGYVAEEIFKHQRVGGDFHRRGFFRGITVHPSVNTTEMGRLSGDQNFHGDVVIEGGVWKKGETIFDVVDELSENDLILKGANALNLARRQAAVLIGHPKAGTVGAALQAVAGRRTGIIIPVGLEKRVDADLYELAVRQNAPGVKGPRLLPVPAEVFTEIDAIRLLSGAKAELVAAGGVLGAEGSVWISVRGTEEACKKAGEILRSVSCEPDFADGLG